MKEIQYLSKEEIGRIETCMEISRDRLILSTLFETGCTVNELVQIETKDIDFEGCVIYFPAENTKTHHGRVSSVSHQLCEQLKSFSQKHKSNYLFTSRQRTQITTKRVRQLIQKYAKLAGFKKVNPQTIRYSHIAHAIAKSIPLTTIQKQVGMKELRMIQIYETLRAKEKEDEYKKFWSKD